MVETAADLGDPDNRCEPPFWRARSSEERQAILWPFQLRYQPYCRNQIWNYYIRLVIIGTAAALFVGLLAGSASAAVSVFSIVLGVGALYTVFVDANPRWRHGLPTCADGPEWKTISYEGFAPPGPGSAPAPDRDARMPWFEEAPELAPNARIPQSAVGLFGRLTNALAADDGDPQLRTPPTAANPFMNVLVDEYKYNPQRPRAMNVGGDAVKKTLDDYFRVQWYSDPTDVFGKSQSQRQFVTEPSTSIPNDQESYQNWLYRIPGKTCKEGGVQACLAGTDGAAQPIFNMP